MARYGEETGRSGRGKGERRMSGGEVGNPVEGIKGIYRKEGGNGIRVVPRTKNPWKSGGKK